jgi:hypothetical protein
MCRSTISMPGFMQKAPSPMNAQNFSGCPPRPVELLKGLFGAARGAGMMCRALNGSLPGRQVNP